MKLSLVAILVGTPVLALRSGLWVFWSGAASIVLLGALVAALGLARSPSSEVTPPSAWSITLRRAARILSPVGFVIALFFLWHVDIFHSANTQLGDRVARAIVTVMITVVVAFLVWDLIRTALAQSVLGPPETKFERGEEGGGTAATALQTVAPVLRNFLFAVVVTVAVMACLASLGVDIAPLLAGAGVIGLALGFGAQTLVRDIISGVFFLAEDAFRTGEYVEIGSTRGTVAGIAIRSLKLRHHRGAIHIVPFGEIKQLTNYSRDWMIVKLEFLLAFNADLKKVKSIVKGIDKELQAHPELGHALMEPIKSQGVRRMEPTGMVVGVKFMAKPGSEAFVLRREIYQRVRDAFEANGIDFARPQVTVATLGGPASSPLQAAAATLATEPPQLAASAYNSGTVA